MVPDVYVNESRDFQLIARAYDCILNGVKFDIDSMERITDTQSCSNLILQLLQSKLGFFTNIDITDEDLRYVLDAFPTLIRWKGTIKAIKEAVNVFLKINHMKTGCFIQIINKATVPDESDYTIKIGIESDVRDTSILTEIFKYILPPGYELYYFFYTSIAPEYQPYEFLSNDLSINVHKTIDIGAISKIDAEDYKQIDGKEYTNISSEANIVMGYYKNGNFYSDEECTSQIMPICCSDSLYYYDKNNQKYYVYVFYRQENVNKFVEVKEFNH